MGAGAPAAPVEPHLHWRDLVDRAGGTAAVANLLKVSTSTVKNGRYPALWADTSRAGPYRSRTLLIENHLRKHGQAVGAPAAANGTGSLPGDADLPPPPDNSKPRGFAAAEAVETVAPVPAAPAGNLSMFPPRPSPSAGSSPAASRTGPSRPPTDASPLNIKEANEYYDLLKSVILPTVAEWADFAISHTNRAQAPAVIWNDLEDDELHVLADAMIGVARVSGQAAQAVRGVVWAWKRVQVGIITVPRFLMTVDHYAENGGVYLPLPASLGRALRSRGRSSAARPKGAPS